MGIQLDVLVDHPEHDLLFVATQVARAAGLKNPSNAIFSFHRKTGKTPELLAWESIKPVSQNLGDHIKNLQGRSWMAAESWLYQMLLRGSSPASEPFRKWVTEEVLPTIRKTGQYNAAESSDPIAQGVMDELRLLRGELVELKGTTYST